MPRTTEENRTSSSLAINGGSPVREVRKQPQVRLTQDVEQKICDLLKRGQFSAWYGGSKSHEFERDFAEYHGRKHAIAVNSGTSALHVAYAAIGISPGHEVILPSTAFVTVASAVVAKFTVRDKRAVQVGGPGAADASRSGVISSEVNPEDNQLRA